MRTLPQLFENNRVWAARHRQRDPAFFSRLSARQSPEYLWIGCSDSRVPANEIVGLDAGELFVHRNVANLVVQTDLNCLSVLQFAVEVLGVRHIIVCGHYGCGGVRAAIDEVDHGLVDNWLRQVKELARAHHAALSGLREDERVDRLCELNVMQQTRNVADTTILEAAWRHRLPVTIHGWIYDIRDGLLRDLGVELSGPP